MKIDDSSESTLILVVDDHLENIQLIGQLLRTVGYRVAVANSGAEALSFVEKVIPDMILLDIMMPKLDGFEVCERLKSNFKTSEIPIVFLTAKNLTDDIVKGFRLGGIDYITKPFNADELLARVKTHIDLKRSKDIISTQNELLKRLNKDKNTFLSITAHDLKNPINVILGLSKLALDRFSFLSEPDFKEFFTDIKDASASMVGIINDLLDINRIEDGSIQFKVEEFDLAKLINEVVIENEQRAQSKNMTFNTNFKNNINGVFADRGKTFQVLDNLLSNALKFSPIGSFITINVSTYTKSNGTLVNWIEIKDNGPGIRKDEMNLLFTKLSKLSSKPTKNEPSTGLGLAIAKGLTEGMKGSIWCESKFGHGSSFFLELPARDHID